MMLDSSSLVFLVIVFLLIMIGAFYWFTSYHIMIEDEIEKDENNKFKDVKFCVLTNYSNNKIEARIVNVIHNKGDLYIYSNISSYHVKQLDDNNYISLLMYTKNSNISKQILIYGYLDKIKELDNLILYKVIKINCKKSVTYEDGDFQITNLSYNDKDGKEIKTSFKELSELIKSVHLDKLS